MGTVTSSRPEAPPIRTLTTPSTKTLASRACGASLAVSGSVKVTVAPRVSLLPVQRRPPCDSMIDRQMASPMPIPCCLVVKNGSKARSASLKPVPASRTSMRIASRPHGTNESGAHACVDDGVHRLDPVPDQVHEHLLHLDAVERDRRQVRLEIVSMRMSFVAILSAISRQTSPITRLTSSDDLACGAWRNRARMRLTTSAAELASRVMRSTVIFARSMLGGSADSQRWQAWELATIAASGWFTS